MRYQPLPRLDEATYLPAIFLAKHLGTRALLVAAQDNVLEMCRSYDVTILRMGVPERQQWDAGIKAALQSCYEIVTKPLSQLKDEILEALRVHAEINLQRCAYCMLNEPKTWDHYLPRTFYPEFSAYHPNLIYICFGCNHKKHDDCDDRELVYCHPYYTVDNNVPILHCDVSIEEDKLAISYYCSGEGAHQAAGSIAQRHLARLGLSLRFKAEASSLVGGFIGDLRVTFPNGISEVSLRNVLRAKYAEAQAHLGINAWDARLWHGLNRCEELLDYINRRIMVDLAPSADGFKIQAPPRPRELNA